jgi:glutamate dehydrogenase/leucine dehydrogenase
MFPAGDIGVGGPEIGLPVQNVQRVLEGDHTGVLYREGKQLGRIR